MITSSQAVVFKKLMLEITEVAGTDKHLDPEMHGIFELFKEIYPDIYDDVLSFLRALKIAMNPSTRMNALYFEIQNEYSIESLEKKYGKELVDVIMSIADQIVS